MYDIHIAIYIIVRAKLEILTQNQIQRKISLK